MSVAATCRTFYSIIALLTRLLLCKSITVSGAVDRATPQRPVYASALAVAIDAERRGALSSLEDDIPPMAPWWWGTACEPGYAHPTDEAGGRWVWLL